MTVLNICNAGDHIVASAEIYGGSINLLSFTLKRYGIDVTFIPVDSTKDEIKAAIQENTRMVYGETIANPAISVLDIEVFAAAAHECSIPLVIDNTFATPILCRPFEWGADIVIHSTSKYMDGHAVQVEDALLPGQQLADFRLCLLQAQRVHQAGGVQHRHRTDDGVVHLVLRQGRKPVLRHVLEAHALRGGCCQGHLHPEGAAGDVVLADAKQVLAVILHGLHGDGQAVEQRKGHADEYLPDQQELQPCHRDQPRQQNADNKGNEDRPNRNRAVVPDQLLSGVRKR